MSSNSSSPTPAVTESKEQASASNNPSVSNTPEPAASAATPAPHKSSTPFKVVHQHIPPAPADGIWTFDAVPCFPGEVIEYEIVKVPPMYEADKEKGELPVRFPKTFLKYDIRPKYIGSPHLIFLNPTNEAFYEESGNLPNPILRIWLLLNHGSWKREANTYVKKRLVEECRRRNIEIKALHPNHFDLMVSKDGFDGLVYKGVQLPLPDCVLTRVGANVGYFGLAVLRQLESLGVFIFNNARGVEISRDKLYTHQVLAGNGVPIPKTVLGKFPIEYEFIEKTFGYPVIVKRTSGSKGDFVWKCDNKEELIAFEQQMIEQDKKEKAQALGLLPPDSSKNSPNVRTASNPATPRTEFTLESAHAGAPSPAAHPSTTVASHSAAPSSHTSAATPLPHPPGASHSSPRPTVPPTAGHSPRPPVVAQTQGHPAAASPSPAPSHIASAASSSAPAPATLPASHSPSSAHPVASTTSSSAASASSSAGTSTSPLSAPPSTPSAAQPGGPPATGDSTALGATEEKPHVPKAKKVSDTEKAYIFQEFLANTKGRDIRAFIVGTRVVASMMRVAAQGQFKANVHQGGSVKTTKLQKRLENMVLKTARLCNLDIAGVDVLLDKDSYKICEVNSSPGFEGLERATAVNVGHEIIEYICNTMEQKGRTRKAITLEAVPLQEEHLDEDGHHAAAATPAADGPANAASASPAVSPAAPAPSGSTGAAGSLTSTPPPAVATAQPQSSQKS